MATGQGPPADSWRELRDDVRALAPPMDPDFERQLSERIAGQGAPALPPNDRVADWAGCVQLLPRSLRCRWRSR